MPSGMVFPKQIVAEESWSILADMRSRTSKALLMLRSLRLSNQIATPSRQQSLCGLLRHAGTK